MSEMMGALRGKVTTAPPRFEARAPVEAETTTAPVYLRVPNHPPLAPDMPDRASCPRKQAGTRLVRVAERPYKDVNAGRKQEANGARQKPNSWRGLSAI